jgi:CMP-N-acetylneuraminic acid synthetase
MISLIIRTYNEEKWIGQCLRAVQQQKVDQETEVVLVDNESTDKTIEKATHVHPELTLIEISDYMPGWALNEGVRASDSEYIVCLSAHCIPVDDQWLQALVDNFDREANVAGVYGRQVPVEASDPVDKRDLIRTFGLERRVQDRDTFFHNANSMVRREVWEEYPFKEDVPNIEDQIWGNEVIDAGYALVYEPDAAVYHHHGINQGNNHGRTKSVVRTMENNEIQPEDTLSQDLHGNPLDPEELDIVAVVPVRHHGNSVVDLDESLVRRTIDAAAESTYIDDIVLSTDTEAVADKASEWGAEAPFLRPDELSANDVPVIEVFKYSLKQLEANDRYPDLVVPLEVTHPFRPPGMLDGLIEQLVREGHDSVVASFPEFRPCWLQSEGGELEQINEDTQFRADRNPVQIGLTSLGCVTYPDQIRRGRRTAEDTGIYEVENPIATIEIRSSDDLEHWERLKDISSMIP